MSSQQAQQQRPEPKPPRYRTTQTPCCYNCKHFESHWCRDGDNDTCSKYGRFEVAPNGLCDSFEANE